jgi:hypothetical protein
MRWDEIKTNMNVMNKRILIFVTLFYITIQYNTYMKGTITIDYSK